MCIRDRGLAGIGDLYVSAVGGRNSLMGSYLGKGFLYSEVKENEMKNITVEGADLAFKIYSLINKDFKLKQMPLMITMIDSIVNNKKISGNAQTRRNHVVLQHGTILVNVNVEKMFDVLKVSDEKIKDKIGNVDLIVGNVATANGTKDLIEAGADAIKVGVGSGSICITRIVTGAGVPQLTAIMNCASVAKDKNIPIIADGGIRNSGDVTKALAAGASTVMIGSLLAGTDESPGIIVSRPNGRYKMTRGMASLGAALDRRTKETNSMDEEEMLEYVPEGVEALVPYRGKASELINKLVGGLRSGLSYSNAKTIEELQKNSQFIRITSAGKAESGAHDVHIVD